MNSQPQLLESSEPLAKSISVLAHADDATLCRALCEGSPQAQRVAWDRFCPMVRRIVRRSLGPEFDAEDVVQEVFFCLYQKVGTLREPAALRGFVMSITVLTVRSTLRSEMRRRKLRRWFGLYREAEPPAIYLVPEETDSREALKRFYGILDRINPRDRAAFVLRFVERMSVADIAAALDVSVPTVRRCFTRAWDRFTLLASRDPFLADYLSKLPVGDES